MQSKVKHQQRAPLPDLWPPRSLIPPGRFRLEGEPPAMHCLPRASASAHCPPCCISHPTRSPISVYRYLDHFVAWDVVEERHAASLRLEGLA